MENNNKFDLEDRLVDFACMCLDVCELLPSSKAGQNSEYQLSKSGTASALIYGEAQAAESRADFIHKMRMCLKESVVVDEKVEQAFNESNELMAIFLKSVETALSNDERRKKH